MYLLSPYPVRSGALGEVIIASGIGALEKLRTEAIEEMKTMLGRCWEEPVSLARDEMESSEGKTM